VTAHLTFHRSQVHQAGDFEKCLSAATFVRPRSVIGAPRDLFRRPSSAPVQGASHDNESQHPNNPPLRQPGSQAQQPCQIDEGQNSTDDEKYDSENSRIRLRHSWPLWKVIFVFVL
jgi:hypothetical protein